MIALDATGLAFPLDENGYICSRLTDDNRVIVVMPLTYGRARLGIGPADSEGLDDVW